MIFSRFSRFSALSIVAVATVAAAAVGTTRAADEPQAMLQTAVDEVLALAYSTSGDAAALAIRVRPVLEKYFAFDLVTQRAIGPGWRQFTPEQQARVTVLFTDLVITTYAGRFTPGEKPNIRFGAPAELSAKRREVPSSIVYQGNTYAVSYRLENTAAGWRIYDVIIEGVSMVANYRSQFDALFQKGGAESIIRALEEKRAI